ncbi:MAG: restriction endonuclease subunit S [Eubacteriaceae bacterium]|nr:restriction endonuclease subunit S [Eubacteriaceae bacterium]
MTPQELRYSIFSHALSGALTTDIVSPFDIKIREIDLGDNAPFEIPEHWKWSALGLLCEMYTGNSIPESVKKAKYEGLKNGYDYIGTKDVSFEHTIAYENGIRIPFDEGFKLAYKGSVLMCIEGGSAGRKIGILDRDVCFGNKLCMFYPDVILNSYLYYYLQSFEFKALFNGMMTGIIGGVSIKKLKEIPIPVPPLAEQKRIVAKIEELLPLIDRYEQAWSRLEDFNKRFPGDMQKSILQMALQGKLVEQRPEEGTGEELYLQIQREKQALINAGKIKRDRRTDEMGMPSDDDIPFEIPETWKWVYLGSILNKLTDGTHKTPKYSTSGVKFVSVKDMSSGFLSLSNTKYITASEHEELYARCDPVRGDMLLSKVGTTGVPAIVDTDEPFSLFVSVALLKYSHDCIDEAFLYYLLKSPLVQMQATENTRGVGNKNWVLDAIAKTIVVLPPLAEQKRIIARLEELLPLCERLK